MSYSRNLAADLVWNAQSQSYVLAPSRIYTSYVELHDNTYYNCQTITHVDAANTPWVNNCMYGAFENCSNLQSVTNINSNVTNMQAAFMNCPKLAAAPILPPSIITLDSTFYGCSNILTMPDIPASVTNMNYAFMYCSNMRTVTTIPSGVNDLNYAFAYTNINTSPALPSNVTGLMYTYAFCKNLNSAPIIPSNASTLEGTFEGCEKLTGDIYVKSNQITNAAECFATTHLTKNVYIPFGYENGVNTATRNAFEAAYPVNTISGTTVGTLTDNNGVVSGFSTNNYITSNINGTYQAGDVDNFEISMKVVTPSSWTSNGRIINWNGGADSTLGPYIEATQSSICLWFYNGTYKSTCALNSPSSNTTYFIKFVYDGNSIKGYYKLNAEDNWILTAETAFAKTEVYFKTTDFTVGGRAFDKLAVCVWNGSIDLKECYIKVNSQNVWNGYVRPNGVVLKNIDGNKITINPTPADAIVSMYNETTGTEIDENVLNKFSYTNVDGNIELQALNTTDTAIVVPSMWNETKSMRAIDGSKVHYKVSKDGYNTIESEITVDGSKTVDVNLEQIMCTFTVVPMPSDAKVTLTTFVGTQYYAWGPYRNSYVYTLSETPLAGDKLFTYDNGEMVYSPSSIAAGNVASLSGNEVINENGFGYERNSSEDIVIGPTQEGNSITVPWGTEVSYTVSKDHYQTVTGTEIVKTTGNKYIPLTIDKYTFTINPTPADAAVQILVNGKLANASNSDWVFTADNLNGDIELQEYTGSSTAVVMPTSYETTNTITADYGSTIEWKVSKDGYKTQSDTFTLVEDLTLPVTLSVTYTLTVNGIGSGAVGTISINDVLQYNRSGYAGDSGDFTGTFAKNSVVEIHWGVEIVNDKEPTMSINNIQVTSGNPMQYTFTLTEDTTVTIST